MTPLTDGDMLLYEVCFGAQFRGDDGELVLPPFSSVIDLLEDKINYIYDETWADEEPILYLTGSDTIKKFKPEYSAEALNFRIDKAVSKVYKGNRKLEKPFHYNNLLLYMLNHCNVKIAWGMEADDMICIDHLADPDNTLRCTRDKDFRGSPGALYGWACGKQPGFPTQIITEEEANKFFFSQMVTGDTVDNIPGLPGCGPAAAKKALADCTSWEELRDATLSLYNARGFDEGYFIEQGNLLWMSRKYNSDGSPQLFEEVYNGKT